MNIYILMRSPYIRLHRLHAIVIILC